jgi:RNA polymerase sigma-70 factor (ECF subfamily)
MEHDESLRKLVRQAQNGDSDCAGQLFDLLADRVFRYFAHRTPTREVAEDLTQVVFLEMIQALPRYKEQVNAKFTTWLFQIAHFRLIDYYRRQRVEPGLDEVAEPAVEARESDPIVHDRLQAALGKLPEQYATVLHLRFQQDLSAAEAAQIMGTTAMNVRVLQHRALKALRKILPAE